MTSPVCQGGHAPEPRPPRPPPSLASLSLRAHVSPRSRLSAPPATLSCTPIPPAAGSQGHGRLEPGHPHAVTCWGAHAYGTRSHVSVPSPIASVSLVVTHSQAPSCLHGPAESKGPTGARGLKGGEPAGVTHPGSPRPLWQGEPCLWPGTEPSELQADPDAKLNFKKDIFKTLEYSQVLFACPLPLLVPSGRSQEQSVETRDRTWLRPAPSAGTRPRPGAGST